MLPKRKLMPSTPKWLCPKCSGRVRYMGTEKQDKRLVFEFECIACGRALFSTRAVSGKPTLSCQSCGFKSAKTNEIKQFGSITKCMTCIKERR